MVHISGQVCGSTMGRNGVVQMHTFSPLLSALVCSSFCVSCYRDTLCACEPKKPMRAPATAAWLWNTIGNQGKELEGKDMTGKITQINCLVGFAVKNTASFKKQNRQW